MQRLEDVKAIKRLQRAYGYYLDKRLSDQLTALFADAPGTSVEYGNAGVDVGKARIGEYLERLIGTGPRDNELFNHIILQRVVHVADDGMTATGAAVTPSGESPDWVVSLTLLRKTRFAAKIPRDEGKIPAPFREHGKLSPVAVETGSPMTGRTATVSPCF